MDKDNLTNQQVRKVETKIAVKILCFTQFLLNRKISTDFIRTFSFLYKNQQTTVNNKIFIT